MWATTKSSYKIKYISNQQSKERPSGLQLGSFLLILIWCRHRYELIKLELDLTTRSRPKPRIGSCPRKILRFLQTLATKKRILSTTFKFYFINHMSTITFNPSIFSSMLVKKNLNEKKSQPFIQTNWN